MAQNQLAKTEGNQLPTAAQAAAQQEFLASDVVIPRLLLMQGLSDFVAERKKTEQGQLVAQGDLVRSTTVEKIGDPETPVEFVPLSIRNEWRIEEKVGGKYQFRRSEPRTAKNDDLPWEYKDGQSEWKRTKVINVFALLPGDIAAEQAEIKKFQETGEMPDLNKTLMPVMISFRSTSFQAGKAVATQFAKAASMAKFGVKPYSFTMQLACHQESNDKGTYYVLEAKAGRKVTAEEMVEADKWANIVSTQQVRVDEAADEGDTGPVDVKSSVSGGDQF